jgi:shikimate dehydrogenase
MSKNYRAELVGALGCPIDENPGGVMEEAAFNALGLFYRFLMIRVEKEFLGDAIKGVRAFNMRGINLTIPHKMEVIQYLDSISEAAAIIGAVNTVINDNGILKGENTDGKGYLISLGKRGVSVRGKHITILGAGGAARAIAVESALAGAVTVNIINRDETRGKELAELIATKTDARSCYIPWIKKVALPEDTEILTNATSIGLYPDVYERPDIDYDMICRNITVADVIINDPHTQFLKEAEKRGAEVIDGLGMLINQGALNFKMWTALDAPVEVMEETLKKEFGLS